MNHIKQIFHSPKMHEFSMTFDNYREFCTYSTEYECFICKICYKSARFIWMMLGNDEYTYVLRAHV